MITTKDVFNIYSVYDDSANIKHNDLNKTLVKKITELASKTYEEGLVGKDFEEGIIFDSMNDEQLIEYSILDAIKTHLNDDDPYLCDIITDRQESLKNECCSFDTVLNIFNEDTDDCFSEYPGNNFDYEREDDSDDCQFD